jgi:hypothetical protein
MMQLKARILWDMMEEHPYLFVVREEFDILYDKSKRNRWNDKYAKIA